MQQLNLKPTHAPVKAYYQALGQYGQLYINHEMVVRAAFQHLLEKCGSQFNWTLIAEYPVPRPKKPPLRVDGALLDEFRLRRGLWKAKDEHDDLEKEAKGKIAAGYPTDNIIFQAPERAILYQNGTHRKTPRRNGTKTCRVGFTSFGITSFAVHWNCGEEHRLGSIGRR